MCSGRNALISRPRVHRGFEFQRGSFKYGGEGHLDPFKFEGGNIPDPKWVWIAPKLLRIGVAGFKNVLVQNYPKPFQLLGPQASYT